MFLIDGSKYYEVKVDNLSAGDREALIADVKIDTISAKLNKKVLRFVLQLNDNFNQKARLSVCYNLNDNSLEKLLMAVYLGDIPDKIEIKELVGKRLVVTLAQRFGTSNYEVRYIKPYYEEKSNNKGEDKNE